MKRIHWVLASLVLILAGGATLWHPTPARFWALVRGERFINVSVVRVRAKPGSVRFAGELYPMRQIDVVSRLAGRVSAVRFKVGDRVAANAVVATVESKSLTQTIATTEAALRAAQDELAVKSEQLTGAEQRLAQTRELYGQDLISRQDLEQAGSVAATAEAEVALARARVAQQQAMLAQARAVARYTRIATPMAGVVIRLWVEVGATIAASAPILTIADVDRLKLTATLSDRESDQIQEGMRVAVSDAKTPGKIFLGEVARVTSQTAANKTEVEIEVNSGGGLRPGVLVDATVLTNQSEQMLWVPVSALMSNSGKTYVYKIAGDRAFRQQVAIGQIQNNEANVTEGLREGELVVAAKPERLKPGTRVRAIAARPNDAR